MLPPSSIETAMPIAGSPLKYIFDSAGSTNRRSILAISASLNILPLALIGRFLIESISSKMPVTLTLTLSLVVSIIPAGVI